MKTNWLVGSVLLAGAMVLRAQTNELNTALRQGLFEEEGNRNLDAAISNYQALATQFDSDRQVAATAIFRLGECYRKLGRTNDAVGQYQRITREFSDQQTLAALSRQNLDGLGHSSADPAGPIPGPGAVRPNPELVRNLEFVKKLQAMPLNEVIQTAPTLLTDAMLINFIYQYNQSELNLLRLKTAYTEDNPVIQKEVVVRDALGKKIYERLEGLSRALSLELTVSGPAGNATADVRTSNPATTDAEDQEIRRIETMIQNSPDLINTPSPHGTPLSEAAGKGWLKAATFLLDHGADVNASGSINRRTPLHEATMAGNKAMVELLLSRGADINLKDSVIGQTALAMAVASGFQAVAEVLLAHHADPNIADNQQTAPLRVAAGHYPKLVPVLLAAGADPSLKDDRGQTPLAAAAGSGLSETVKMLLAAGADPNAADNDGTPPLSCAVVARDPAGTIKVLLAAKADPNGGSRNAPLLAAIRKPDIAAAELLLQAGADPNRKGLVDQDPRDGNGYADPLWLAVTMNQLPLVQMLLKFKADPNDSQIGGQSLLFSALANTNILKTLLDAGAKVDPRTRDEANLTPLGAAARQNLVAAVEVLLKHGADPNVRNSNGATPLHWATYGLADSKIFQLLLDGKADPNVRSSNGRTPLDELKQWGGGNNLSLERKALAGQLAGLLRQYGALDNLPNWDRITVSRPAANFSQTVFQKGTNDWNRFTLLETLLNFYSKPSPRFAVLPLGSGGTASEISLPFPDLTRVTIIRHQPNTPNETPLKVNLLDATNGIDCSRDVPMEFGDVVEIPEREHALGDRPVGLTDNQRDTILNGLKGSVRLVVHGAKVELPVNPDDSSLVGSVFNLPEAQGVLQSSSDLSRVKVTRADPVTGKKREWILDCSRMSHSGNNPFYLDQRDDPHYNAPGLRLRNGDVIEVPEKP